MKIKKFHADRPTLQPQEETIQPKQRPPPPAPPPKTFAKKPKPAKIEPDYIEVLPSTPPVAGPEQKTLEDAKPDVDDVTQAGDDSAAGARD